MQLNKILEKNELNKSDISFLLNLDKEDDLLKLSSKANDVLYSHISNEVFIRGLIEFSNYCTCDCSYCGIRKSNQNQIRYQLSIEEIATCINWAVEKKFASVVLQSGERNDRNFIYYVVDLIKTIKRISKNDILDDGFSITLSIGEQSADDYKRLFEAGAERFLLRIETTNPLLFEKLHGKSADYDKRLKNILLLKDIGFQVGTGVMIGLPEQTVDNLADDIMFFKEHDIDMIGMGPYIPHHDTPLGKEYLENNMPYNAKRQLQLGLNMIAVARIVLKDVNIASTTALETLDSSGRILGLQYGANVVMPQLTPNTYKSNYLLYDKKPVIDEQNDAMLNKLNSDCLKIGRQVAFNKHGNPLHYMNKKNFL